MLYLLYPYAMTQVTFDANHDEVMDAEEMKLYLVAVRPRVISDCHFSKTATEYDRKPGIKWLSRTAK